MGRIPEETIRKVLEATDIVALIGSYIPLKKAGTIYKGCCPFHNEKTPSFTVSSSRQSFKCFGCGEGGSAIGFVMKYENLAFVDALRKLADKASIRIEEEAYDPHADKERRRRMRLIELHRDAAAWFHEQLMASPDAEHARAYLRERGYADSLAENWQIGWVPEEGRPFLKWAKEKGFNGRELVASGMFFLRNENNPRSGLMGRFRDRLMFPIANDYGEIVAFSGRILEEKANTGKYINSPETQIFRKGNVIFGLNRARRGIAKKEFAIICEGQIDVIACHEAGVDNAIAPLGTAFTTQQARLIRRYTTRVTLCFDGDSAGMKAADRAFRELAPEGLHVSLAVLPEGEDPDSLIKKQGAEGFLELISSAQPYFKARMQRAQREGVLDDPSKRSEFVTDMAYAMALIPDTIYRDGIITDIGTLLRIGIQELRKEVAEAVKEVAFKKREEVRREKVLKEREYASHSLSAQKAVDDGVRSGNGNNEPEFEPETGDSDPWRQPEVGVDLTPRIIPMEQALLQLCELALQFGDAQRLLLSQIEDLYVPMDTLRGGFLLKKILEDTVDVSSPAGVHVFMERLSPSEAYTLRQLDLGKPPLGTEELERSVHELVAEVSRLSLFKERDSIIARISAPNISREEQCDLLARLQELAQLLM